MVIQLVYLGGTNYLGITGIKPDQDSPTGEITIIPNTTCTERKERYTIENGLLITDNFFIPMPLIINFLASNDCVQIGEDGKEHVVLKEVEFRRNSLK